MCLPRKARSRAFTLFELVIMIAIMALLLALLLPTVVRIRETSDRMTCLNHLKTIGQGFQDYHATHDRFPDGGKNMCDAPYHPLMPARVRSLCDQFGPAQIPAWQVPYNPGGPTEQRRSEWSWPYQILPYIGYDWLHRNPNDQYVPRVVIPMYFCPSRRPPQLYAGHALIDYAGNAGTNGENGVVVRLGKDPVRLRDITDGPSHTLMVSEKRLQRDRIGLSYDDNESWANPGWDTEIYRLAAADRDRPHWDRGPSPDIAQTLRSGHGDPNVGLVQFGSSHPRGVNAIMADGSRRFIRFGIHPATMEALCGRNNGINNRTE